jgi:FlaG/FlaF family flagellin (archaellin)
MFFMCLAWFKFLAVGILLCVSTSVFAFVTTISAGTRALYLQVGMGSMTGGNGSYSGGATPGNNATINLVSVSVPAAAIGTGTQAMTTNSTQTISAFDNYVGYCSAPSQVYIGGLYRVPGAATNATLSVTSPLSLDSLPATFVIPFNSISWVGGGKGDSPATIASGTFVGGTTQPLLSIAANKWFEACLAFNYANAQIYPAGIYTGRVTYTLSAP